MGSRWAMRPGNARGAWKRKMLRPQAERHLAPACPRLELPAVVSPTLMRTVLGLHMSLEQVDWWRADEAGDEDAKPAAR